MLVRHGLPVDSFESFVLCEGSQVYLRSTAYIRIAKRLRFPWKLAAAIWIVPRPLRDRLYDLIARHRYRWFGRREHCMVLASGRSVRLLSREGTGTSAPANNSLEGSRDGTNGIRKGC
jgi:predicted DCC family thiol-disulfide oxidoreductase YuxK